MYATLCYFMPMVWHSPIGCPPPQVDARPSRIPQPAQLLSLYSATKTSRCAESQHHPHSCFESQNQEIHIVITREMHVVIVEIHSHCFHLTPHKGKSLMRRNW